jgi:phosphatidylglycerophosphate synthase
MKHVPNLLSALRLLLGLTFFLYPPAWRLGVIALALLTEYLDGKIARAFDAETKLGIFLDPVADKTFVFAVLLTLTWDGLILPWELAFIAARDIIVAGAVVWFSFTKELARIRGMHVAMPGKVATTLQFVLLLALSGGWRWPPLVYATGLASLGAGLDYVRRGWKRRSV